MNDPLWSNLDNAVSSRLSEYSKFCDSLSAKVKLLEDSIYEEEVLIFGHPLTKKKIFLEKAEELFNPLS